jgi:hypothetical protein
MKPIPRPGKLFCLGKGAGQWRKIIEYGNTLTVDWTIVPDETSVFTVVKAIKGNVI